MAEIRRRTDDKIMKECEFGKLVDWECLYVHRELKLFLSVYADDQQMAGKKKNLGAMWKLWFAMVPRLKWCSHSPTMCKLRCSGVNVPSDVSMS